MTHIRSVSLVLLLGYVSNLTARDVMVTEQKYETLRLREAVTEGISLGVIPSTTFPLHQTFSTVKECHTYTVLAAK